MLFSTSLVALILSPRRLQITNTKVRRSPQVGIHSFLLLFLIKTTEIAIEISVALRLRGMLLTLLHVYIIAPIHNMRIDVSHYRACGQVEPETIGDRTRRPDLSL